MTSVTTKLNNLPKKQTPSLFRVDKITCQMDKIVVPSWYPKKFISSEEIDHTIYLLENKKLGWEKVVVRYIKTAADPNGCYELVRGLVTFRAYQILSRSEIECEMLDGSSFNKSEAIVTSLSYNCFTPLNHWESTIAGLSFLVEELKLETIEKWFDMPAIGVRNKRTISQLDQAVGKCSCLLIKRKGALKLKKQSDYYDAIVKNIDDVTEEAIDRMLGAIQIDLTTFVTKRIPLVKLPRNITNALSSGKLHYSKAIALSRIGKSKQIQALVDLLDDITVKNAINKEQAELLDKTLEFNWTNTTLNEEIALANRRILLVGTNEDDGELSVDEIGDRKEIKQDLKLQADVVSTLNRIKSRINNFDFLSQLSDREKSQFQLKVNSLNNLIASAEEKIAKSSR